MAKHTKSQRMSQAIDKIQTGSQEIEALMENIIKTNCPLCGHQLEGKPDDMIICPECGEYGSIKEAAFYWELLNLND